MIACSASSVCGKVSGFVQDLRHVYTFNWFLGYIISIYLTKALENRNTISQSFLQSYELHVLMHKEIILYL